MKVANHGTATFARCRELRELAGLSMNDLVKRLQNSPSRSTLARLESGEPVRTSTAFRVAHSVNERLVEMGLVGINVEQEVQRIWRGRVSVSSIDQRRHEGKMDLKPEMNLTHDEAVERLRILAAVVTRVTSARPNHSPKKTYGPLSEQEKRNIAIVQKSL